MRLKKFYALGVVAILVCIATGVTVGSGTQCSQHYEELADIIISRASESDFPALYGYGNMAYTVYGIEKPDGNLSITVSQIDLSSSVVTNFTVAVLSPENRSEASTAPSIAFHNNTIYVSWAEATGIVLAVIENGTVVNTTKIGGFATNYHAPSLANLGKELIVTFVCGNQTENATLVVVRLNEIGNFQMEVLDALPFASISPRKPACGYDIYGISHVFLSNYSTIEHYYSNGTRWHHEKLGYGFTLASELNVRFVNNLCYLGFWVSNGATMNAVLGKWQLTPNGSLGEMEHIILSSSSQASQEQLYFTPRVYVTPTGTRTVYACWSERENSTNLDCKVGKIVGGEFVGSQSIGDGKICGVFVEAGKLYMIAIDNGFLHYRVFKIHREDIVLTILETAPTKVTLGWSRCYDEDFGWYEVHLAQQENFTPTLGTLYAIIYDQEQTVCSVENLELGNVFFFLLVVRFTNNDTLFSNWVCYKTPLPAECVNATVTSVGTDRFTLSWEQKNCLNFELHLSQTPDFSEELTVLLPNTTTTYTFDALDPGTTYFVYVRSIGFYGDRADSVVISVLTKPEMLAAVAEVEKITISWRALGHRFFEKTEIYASRDIGKIFESGSLLTVIYEPRISNLTITMGYENINTEFYFGIIVYNTFQQSAASNIVSNRTYLPSIPEISLSKYEILNATTVKIHLPATDYAYFSRLEIHLSFEENFTPSDRTLVFVLYTQGETTYMLYGLTPDVDYYVRVVLVDVFGQLSISQSLRVRTTASIEVKQPPPEIPFYLYGLLLLIFFLSSLISALYLNVIRRRGSA